MVHFVSSFLKKDSPLLTSMYGGGEKRLNISIKLGYYNNLKKLLLYLY